VVGNNKTIMITDVVIEKEERRKERRKEGKKGGRNLAYHTDTHLQHPQNKEWRKVNRFLFLQELDQMVVEFLRL